MRILTYNVHGCVGTDGRLSPARIAAAIAACRPDVVALQELDVRRARSGGIDQAQAIAQDLGMRHVHFHPALRVGEEEYGNAILTASPSRLVKAGTLPGVPRWPVIESRGALWVSVQVGDAEVQVINTHLGLSRRERMDQVEALLGPEWLAHPDCREPVVLLGDLNAAPRSPACLRLAGRLRDAQDALHIHHSPRPTFPSWLPMRRIDHVFLGGAVEVLRVEAVRTPLARLASDHLPLLVELRIAPDGGGRD